MKKKNTGITCYVVCVKPNETGWHLCGNAHETYEAAEAFIKRTKEFNMKHPNTQLRNWEYKIEKWENCKLV